MEYGNFKFEFSKWTEFWEMEWNVFFFKFEKHRKLSKISKFILKKKEEERMKNGTRRDKLWWRKTARSSPFDPTPSQRAIESISVGSGPSKRSIVRPVTESERFGSMEDLMSRIPTLFRVTVTGPGPGLQRQKGKGRIYFYLEHRNETFFARFTAYLRDDWKTSVRCKSFCHWFRLNRLSSRE